MRSATTKAPHLNRMGRRRTWAILAQAEAAELRPSIGKMSRKRGCE